MSDYRTNAAVLNPSQEGAKKVDDRLSPRMARGTRREGRDDSCIPDVQPVVSSVHPEVVIDRRFWVESIAVFQALVSENAASASTIVSAAASPPRAFNCPNGSPETDSVIATDLPKLTQENVAFAHDGSVQAFHKQLFRKHMALAGLLELGGPSPSPRQEEAVNAQQAHPDGGCASLVASAGATVVDAPGLQRMLESIGASCSTAVVTALMKLVQYATLDVRTLIRERSTSPGRLVGTTGAATAADRISIARVSQLLRAVSTVIARRLVAVKLFQRHNVVAGSESFVRRHDTLFASAASTAVNDASAATTCAPSSPPLSAPPNSNNLAAMAAVDHVLEEALALTRHRSREGLLASAPATASTPTRRDSSGSARATPVIDKSSMFLSPRRGDAVASPAPSTSGVPRSVVGSGGAPASVASSSRRGSNNLLFVPTRAYLLRSDPNIRSPPLDVNGRRVSSPGRRPSQEALRHSASPARRTANSTPTIKQEGTGSNAGSVVRRLSDAAASPRRREGQCGGEDPRTTSAASVCSSSGSRLMTPTRCRSPVAAVGSSRPSPGRSSPAAAAAPSSMGFNKTHHAAHVAKSFGHVGARVQHMHMSAVVHDPVGSANPFTTAATVNSVASRSSPTRRDGASLPKRGASPSAPTLHHHSTLGKPHRCHADAYYPSGVHRSLASELFAQQHQQNQQQLSPGKYPVDHRLVVEDHHNQSEPSALQMVLPKTIAIPSFRKVAPPPQQRAAERAAAQDEPVSACAPHSAGPQPSPMSVQTADSCAVQEPSTNVCTSAGQDPSSAIPTPTTAELQEASSPQEEW